MIIHWTNKGGYVADAYYNVGSKLVGIVEKGIRPDSLTIGKFELEYFRDNPSYLARLINVFRDKE